MAGPIIREVAFSPIQYFFSESLSEEQCRLSLWRNCRVASLSDRWYLSERHSRNFVVDRLTVWTGWGWINGTPWPNYRTSLCQSPISKGMRLFSGMTTSRHVCRTCLNRCSINEVNAGCKLDRRNFSNQINSYFHKFGLNCSTKLPNKKYAEEKCFLDIFPWFRLPWCL